MQATSETEWLREHYVQQRRLAERIGLDALGNPWSSSNTVPSSLTSYRDLKADFFNRDEYGNDDASRWDRL